MAPLRRLHRLLLAAVLAVLPACTGPPAPPVADLTGSLDALFAAGGSGRYEQVRAVIVDVAGERRYVHGDPGARGDVGAIATGVVATLIGIAIDEGRIRDVDQPLGELLPASPVLPPGLRAATLRQALTTPEERPAAPADDGVSDGGALDRRTGAGAGSDLASAGPELLPAVLAQATGRPVGEYARDELFGPLAIRTDPASGFAWPVGSGDLVISADDMLALGRLYLGGGRWAGRQVVSSEWVAAATGAQVPTGFASPGYGYRWWVTEADGHHAFAAVGHGGQLIEVVPDLQLVVVVASDVGTAAGAPARAYVELVDAVVAPAVG
jgi:CubicO group peptidase (beta-lactamase class C family)